MSECKGQASNTAPPSGLADALWRVGLVQGARVAAPEVRAVRTASRGPGTVERWPADKTYHLSMLGRDLRRCILPEELIGLDALLFRLIDFATPAPYAPGEVPRSATVEPLERKVLAELLGGVSLTTVSNKLRKLESLGLIERLYGPWNQGGITVTLHVHKIYGLIDGRGYALPPKPWSGARSQAAEVARLKSLLEKFKTTAMEIIPSSQEGFDRLDDEEECNDCGYEGALVDNAHGESGDFGALGQGDGPACPICVATANTLGACEVHAFERIYDTLGRLVMLAEGAS